MSIKKHITQPTKQQFELFQNKFGCQPSHVASVPGRVNLIGEHTDYNMGLALPMTIDRRMSIVFRARDDRQVAIYSANFDQDCKFSLDDLARNSSVQWQDYIKGAAFVLLKEGYELRGFDAVLEGNIPIASGLSSSAALEVASILAFGTASSIEFESLLKVARLAQRSENEFVGVQCGLMDQLASACGERSHALYVDFKTNAIEKIPLSSDIAIVVGDSKLSRNLAGSTYNKRRSECELAAKLIFEKFSQWNLDSISDLNPQQLPSIQGVLPEVAYRRVKHVVSENQRVRDALSALKESDFARFGSILSDSHRSLRVDYEVSSGGLNAIVEKMEEHPACYGARLTGAGFGGCVVAAVEKPNADRFIRDVTKNCNNLKPVPELFLVEPAPGGKVHSVDQ